MAPTAVKSGYITNGPRLFLNYLEWGPPDAPTVLFIHGLSQFAYTWNATAQALAGRHRCVAINLRGHGDSSPSPERRYSLDLHAGDIHTLVTALGLERPVVCGHSLGGRVAIAFAGRHPELAGGLIVVDVAPGMTEPGAWGLKQRMEERPLEFDSWEEAFAWHREHWPTVSDATIEAWTPYALRWLPSGKLASKLDPLVRDEWLGEGLPDRALSHVWDEMAAVECPVLVLKGQETPHLTHELCERMVGQVKEGRWTEVPGTTHTIMHDDLPAFLKQAEPFIGEVVS